MLIAGSAEVLKCLSESSSIDADGTFDAIPHVFKTTVQLAFIRAGEQLSKSIFCYDGKVSGYVQNILSYFA